MDQTSFHEKFETYPLFKEMSVQDFTEFTRNVSLAGIQYFTGVDTDEFHTNLEKTDYLEDIYHHIPHNGKSKHELLTYFQKTLLPHFVSTGNKHFLAYVPSDPHPLAVSFASLTPFFNQFTGSLQGSPGGTAIEALVIHWIAELLGFPKTTFGSFTSGGSMANMTCMYTGLVHQLKVHGIDLKEDGLIGKRRPLIYISDQTHNAIEKAILMLGLGKRSVRVVKSNSSYEMTKELVEQAITEDLDTSGNDILPIMIVGTAGTTNTGSIDDLTGLRELANNYKMWFHIDGAYGAFTRLSDHSVVKRIEPLNQADSIALDCHKWLYTPFEAGIALVRDQNIMRSAFELTAEYLKDSEMEETHPLKVNFRSYGFPLTRELRGLKVWAVISVMGKNGLRNAITRDLLKADYLRAKIKEDPNFELVPHGPLSVVCFRYKGSDDENDKIIQILQERKRFYLSRTTLEGKLVLRVCIINRRSDLETMDELLEELNQILNGH